MGEQQSQKRGVKSDAQKRARARNEYDPVPASSPTAGAFGKHGADRRSGKDTALETNDSRQAKREKDLKRARQD